jgi:hypothetical protein
MRKTVYLKFIMGYIIFALFGFLVVSSFVTSMVRRSLLAHESEALYKEAVQIADTFASGLYNNVITLESAKPQIDILQSYLSATIWIINPSGLIILDSSTPLDITAEDVYVEGFGELIDNTEFYEVTTLSGYWDSNHLCVYAPITNGYTVQGYVVISKPMETVDAFLEVPRSMGSDGDLSAPNDPIVIDKAVMIDPDENGNPRAEFTMK